MILPFGLKQKPLRHYFTGGSISFNVYNGELFYRVHHTTGYGKSFTKWVSVGYKIKDKEHLDKLLSIKSLNEIPTIEVEN